MAIIYSIFYDIHPANVIDFINDTRVTLVTLNNTKHQGVTSRNQGNRHLYHPNTIVRFTVFKKKDNLENSDIKSYKFKTHDLL